MGEIVASMELENAVDRDIASDGLLSNIANTLCCDDGSIQRDFDRYVIPDLIPCTAKTILLLESPHVDEVEAKHPLAGRSGKAITRALNRNESIQPMLAEIGGANDEAIGCILKQYPGTLCLGLMNASRLPLQIGGYCPGQPARRPETFRILDKWYHWQRHSDFLGFLHAVRLLPELLSVKTDSHAYRVYRDLLNDLKSRLENLPECVLVVPCGEVARAFVKGAMGNEYQSPPGFDQVPHPSNRHWERKDENGNQVVELVNKIQSRAMPDASASATPSRLAPMAKPPG